MSISAEAAVLLGAGVLAGIVGTVASLASAVSYPALLALGLPPVSANVTNTVALMFTAVGASAGSRPELTGQARWVLRLGLLTAAGGGTGAALLLLTPSRGFEYVAPVLVAAGSLAILRRPVPPPPAEPVPPAETALPAPAELPSSAALPAALPAKLAAKPVIPATPAAGWRWRAGVFAVAVYVGYFGAAGGVLMLAVLIRPFRQSLARTNAVKNVVAGLANAVAGAGFAIFGPVRWAAAVPLAIGFLAGGWIGPALVRRLPAGILRAFVGACGLAVAIRLGVSAY